MTYGEVMQEKKYWYAFAFQFPTETGFGFSSVYSGFDSNLVKKNGIDEARRASRAPDGAVMINCSYLGHMTREEFEGEGQ